MMKTRLTPRMVEFFTGILATALIAAGLLLYALDEPERIVEAQGAQLNSDVDEAMTLYAENCAVCHGLAGEGIGATPALDNPGLRSADYDGLHKIIARGLYGTAMPAWSSEDGGPLGDYQIGELVTLIQFGAWEAVQDRVVNLGVAPQVPFTTEPDPVILASLEELAEGVSLVPGVQLYAKYCVACHGADGLGTGIAPALNDPVVRQKSPTELERTILNGVSGTVMAPWGNTLEDEEVAALVTLLLAWEQVPSGAIPAPDKPIPVTAESLALGEELYAASCAHCHASEGQGTLRAPALNVKGFLKATNDLALQQIITLGVPGTAMPAWGDRLSDVEIQAIIGFLRAWEPTAPEVAEPERGGGGPWWRAQEGSSQLGLPSGGAGESRVGAAGEGEHAGGGPPWAQPAEPDPWWVSLNWRVVAVVGGVALASLLLSTIALAGARRLPVAEREKKEPQSPTGVL